MAERADAARRRQTGAREIAQMEYPRPARKMMRMEWPSTVADDDAVIVREEMPDRVCFVVHSRRNPQFTCPTYVEAEARALAYARHANAHAWYTNGSGLQLLGSAASPVSPPPPRQRGDAGRRTQLRTGAEP